MNWRIVVTCGPSYEPIDEVRRITNFSTGQLGSILSNRLAQDGHEVICLRGSAASRSVTLDQRVMHTPFSTNEDLLEKLSALAGREHVAAVFHAAALADFTVDRAHMTRKISSRIGPVTLKLIPATKLIGRLRELFPSAWLVGWKYEMDGSPHDAIATAREQIVENGTDACVVNGAAYGEGYGFLPREGDLTHLADKLELAAFLATQLSSGARQATE